MESEVTYRQLTFEDSQDKLSGFALWYKDQEAARLFFNFVSRYFQEKNHGRIEVKFASEENAYKLTVSIPTEEMKHLTEIRGIALHHVEQLRQTLRQYPYIPILAGYTNNDGEDNFIENCHYETGQISIDGSIVDGAAKTPYPLHLIKKLFSGDSREEKKHA